VEKCKNLSGGRSFQPTSESMRPGSRAVSASLLASNRLYSCPPQSHVSPTWKQTKHTESFSPI
jgi:hypothetical protein